MSPSDCQIPAQDELILNVGPPMCIRTLLRVLDDDVTTVSVRMSRPIEWKKNLWVCFYQITGVDMEKPRPILGADSFQAVELTLQDIRRFLDQTRGEFMWGSPLNGTGFPRNIPWYGSKFSKQCERLIDSEIEKFSASTAEKK